MAPNILSTNDDSAYTNHEEKGNMTSMDLPNKNASSYTNHVKKETQIGGTMGSIHLELGSYEAAKLPVVVAIFSIISGIIASYSDEMHPESLKYPLINNYAEMIAIVMLYLLASLVWGPRYMRDRNPYKIKKIIMAYNVFQVVICSYIFYEAGVSGWFGNYNWICQPINKSDPMESRMYFAGYMYYLTKILDFFDTIFFVLNKKWSHISVLHIVHHSNMFIGGWVGMRTQGSGHLTFFVFLNSGVHILMYTYYLLASLGPKVRPYLWWKKYLTTIQLIQFTLVFIHATQALLTGCNIHKGMACNIVLFAVIFFSLFMDFYLKAYKNTDIKEQKKELTEEKCKTEESKADIKEFAISRLIIQESRAINRHKGI